MKNLTSVLLFLSFAASAEILKNFDKQNYVVGVGQVRLKYVFLGEPVSRPRSLKIWVKCEKSKEWKAVGEYQMCALDKYEVDTKAKKLSVNYLDGRVNLQTGESHCDQVGSGEVDLAKQCKP
jgi:hypothetical protein